MAEVAPPSAPDVTPVPGTTRLGTVAGWVVMLAILAVLGFELVFGRPPRPANVGAGPREVVRVSASALELPADGPFAERLQRVNVRAKRASAPRLEVAGRVVARFSARQGEPPDWTFATEELTSTYGEWSQIRLELRNLADLAQTTGALHGARVRAQLAVVARLEKLVAAGADAPKDLASEEAGLIERRLESDRARHEMAGLKRATIRKRATLERRLEQLGVDPSLLDDAAPVGRALVEADVPEARAERVQLGQACSVAFLARGRAPATASISRILPGVSASRRSLRAILTLEDTAELLRPGMWASVSVGVEEREVVLVPAAAILHHGRLDYVLAQRGDVFGPVRVEVGATRGDEIEVFGLTAPAVVIGEGAILLKPALVRALDGVSG